MKLVYIAIILTCLLSGCATYKRCQSRFATTISDTVSVQVPVSVLVPRDSVVTSFKTDTTYYYKEIQQGRAKVIVERTHNLTTLQARCDTVTITKLVKVSVPAETINWGVAPWYKKAFIFMLYLFIFAAGAVFINYQNRDD